MGIARNRRKVCWSIFGIGISKFYIVEYLLLWFVWQNIFISAFRLCLQSCHSHTLFTCYLYQRRFVCVCVWKILSYYHFLTVSLHFNMSLSFLAWLYLAIFLSFTPCFQWRHDWTQRCFKYITMILHDIKDMGKIFQYCVLAMKVDKK